MKHFLSAAFTVIGLSGAVHGALINVDTPGDPIIALGGTIAGGPNGDAGNSPGAETVDHAIDGVGQKYLNFGDSGDQGINSGFATTTAGAGSNVVTEIQVFTANDSEGRDPNGFTLEGSNGGLTGPWTLIASGPLTLPSSRQPGGNTALDPNNSQTVSFANTTAYDNYRVLWTGKKDIIEGCCIQVGEVELLGMTVPEPASIGLLGLSCLGILARRRRA